jgi:hypothetical protein
MGTLVPRITAQVGVGSTSLTSTPHAVRPTGREEGV